MLEQKTFKLYLEKFNQYNQKIDEVLQIQEEILSKTRNNPVVENSFYSEMKVFEPTGISYKNMLKSYISGINILLNLKEEIENSNKEISNKRKKEIEILSKKVVTELTNAEKFLDESKTKIDELINECNYYKNEV